jgi:hypothetical protein
MQGSGHRAVVETTLTASDTLTYIPNTDQKLIIRNTTAGSITVTIDGADGTSVNLPGYGPLTVSSGYVPSAIPVGGVRMISLDSIFPYLQGTIAITGASGARAILLNDMPAE